MTYAGDPMRDLRAAIEQVRDDLDRRTYRPEPILLHPRDYAERAERHGPNCSSWFAPGSLAQVAPLCDCAATHDGPGR